MQNNHQIAFAFVTLVAMGTVMMSAHSQSRPAPAADASRVRIANAGRPEAVPVSIQEMQLPAGQTGPGLRVEVINRPMVMIDSTNKPMVTIDPSSMMTVKILRDVWEYKEIKIPNWEDAAPLLNAEGRAGWETTGVMFSAAGGTTLVLKRQK